MLLRLGKKLPQSSARFSSQNNVNIVFDRDLKRRQRDWSFSRPESDYYDYLRKELAERIVDRYILTNANDLKIHLCWMINLLIPVEIIY